MVTWPGNVPFLGARETELRVPLADSGGASQACPIQPIGTPRSILELRVHEMDERPLVALSVNGRSILCFIDTGSQITLIKPSALGEIDHDNSLPKKPSLKTLQGISGKPFISMTEVCLGFNLKKGLIHYRRTTVADLYFPGEVLLGIDFLRSAFYFAVRRPFFDRHTNFGRLPLPSRVYRSKIS